MPVRFHYRTKFVKIFQVERAAMNAPQSRRSAQFQKREKSRSVWSAMALASFCVPAKENLLDITFGENYGSLLMKRIPAWWRWSFLMLASLVFAYSQGWSKISLIPLVIFGVIGFARIFFAIVMRVMSRNLATMAPETREKILAGMSEEKKRKLLAEYGIQEEAPPEKICEAVDTLERFARDIMRHYGEQNFQGDTQPKQILSVYCFGAVSAFATQNGLIPAQAHAVCLTLFTNVFGFPADDAAAKAQAVITAAPDRTSHLYAIIHRGADAYMHWQQHRNDGAAKDFAEIMEKVKNA